MRSIAICRKEYRNSIWGQGYLLKTRLRNRCRIKANWTSKLLKAFWRSLKFLWIRFNLEKLQISIVVKTALPYNDKVCSKLIGIRLSTRGILEEVRMFKRIDLKILEIHHQEPLSLKESLNRMVADSNLSSTTFQGRRTRLMTTESSTTRTGRATRPMWATILIKAEGEVAQWERIKVSTRYSCRRIIHPTNEISDQLIMISAISIE